MKFKKGSAEAKAFMAKLRAAKGKTKKAKVGAAKKKAAPKKTIGAYYGMFTKEGNKKVTELVKDAKTKKLNTLQVSKKLHTLAKTHPEALDTAVLEYVYEDVFEKPTKKKIGAVKKKSAPKKKAAIKKKAAVKSLHKDTKSHNVNIRVMSGMKKSSHSIYNNVSEEINKAKKCILYAEDNIIRLKSFGNAPTAKKSIKMWKDYIKEYKTHITQLKKYI